MLIRIGSLKIGDVNGHTTGCINNLLKQLSLSGNPRKLSVEDVQRIINIPGNEILVAIDKDRPTRIIGMGIIHSWEVFSRKKAFIDDVVIDKDYQGHGCGKKLMKLLIKEAEKIRIDLKSEPSRKAAIHVYKNLGFKKGKHLFEREPN